MSNSPELQFTPRYTNEISQNFAPAGNDRLTSAYFSVLLFLSPVTSVLLFGVQGLTPAVIVLAGGLVLLARFDRRYAKTLIFVSIFLFFYVVYMILSMSGYAVSYPDLGNAIMIRDIRVYGELRQSNISQGVYLLSSAVFFAMIYQYFNEKFLTYIFIGLFALCCYGIYEFMYFAIYHLSGDFLSNRMYGASADTDDPNAYLNGSLFQTSILFGSGFMRLKSLTGEPSMFSLTITPFAIYAFATRRIKLFSFFAFCLVLSNSSTAIIGAVVGLLYLYSNKKGVFIVAAALFVLLILLLYLTSNSVGDALDTLLFKKMDSFSGQDRLGTMLNHINIVLDGNLLRLAFGLGFGTVRSPDMFSTLFANVGVVGVGIYSLVVLYPVFMLRRTGDSRAIIAALLAIYVMEMATVAEFSYLPPWFMIALGYIRLREQGRWIEAPRGAAPILIAN